MSKTNLSAGPKAAKSRIPVPENGLQYNFCKNPKCANYGVAPTSLAPKGLYALAYGGKGMPLLKCNACGENPPFKSNAGIREEMQRISAYLHITTPESTTTCTNSDCQNHSIPVTTPKAYRSFGKAASDAKRYQCSICHKTVSVPLPTQWQRDTHQNIQIFKCLVNKVPLSRIVEMLDISWAVLYNRIDFIHCQCLAFVADRERRLKTLHIRRVYLAIDRQDYEVNWTERKDKRNIVLSAMTSADNRTGYVFGAHPNFDYTLDKLAIENDAKEINDAANAAPFKKYARLWLESDYIEAINNKKLKKFVYTASLNDSIAQKYKEVIEREDVEAFDEKTIEEKLPNYGLQIRAEYTMIAHFYFLKKLLSNVEKWRFFLDQESGIRSACLSAFQEEVSQKRAEAFYVRIEKELTVDEKRRLNAAAKKRFSALKANYPDLTDTQIKLELLKQEIQSTTALGHWKDKWVKHPIPDMSEANKAMCWLTEHDEFDMDHKAFLYNKASLHSVDSFFEKVRRRVYMLERSIHSSSSAGRTWSGYAAYNPAMVVKLMEIFRVVHNYIDSRKIDGIASTPAMRLGLAKAKLDYGYILYFK
jgi:transposase-like protein